MPACAAQSDAETRAREELAACYRLAARAGWDLLVSTHISARVPGTADILMNPMGYLFEEVTASSLVRIDPDGGIVADPTGLGYNAGGFVTHGILHRHRADAECIVHLHPKAATALSCRRQGLLPLTDEAAAIAADLAYHDYEDGPQHLAAPEGLLASFGDRGYLIQRNHGVFTIGASIAQAWLRMCRLVFACEVQLLALAADGVVDLIPAPSEHPAARAARERKTARVDALAWAALLRKLDRDTPDFRR